MQSLRAAGAADTVGLGDPQQSFFFAPTQTVKGFILGAGLIPLFTAAIDDLLGSEKWGPAPPGCFCANRGVDLRGRGQLMMVLRRRRPEGPPPPGGGTGEEKSTMENQLEKLQQIGELMMTHGLQLIHGLLVVIIGLMIVRWLVGALRKVLARLLPNRKGNATFTSVVGVVLVLVVVIAASVQSGLPIRPILRLLVVGVLVATGAIILCRPLLPDLPFRVGNTIKVGEVLGKVDGITFLNTRIRTFDGKTIFIPNQKIFDSIVSNYHFTRTRRIKINVGIRYDSDLIRAKQIMEELMIEDPRVELTPRAVVYVLSLTKDCVELGARCWVPNLNYWVTKCDLLEKLKLTFDREGIRIAHAQVDIYHHGEGEAPDLGDSDAEEWS